MAKTSWTFITQAGLQNTLTHLCYTNGMCSYRVAYWGFRQGLGKRLMQDRYATVNLIKASLLRTL